MRPYEVMVILDTSLEEDAIRATLDRATKVVAGGGGLVGRVERLGRRRFAYELHHRTEGYYAVVEITAQPAVIADLDRMLGLADEVVRHKVIRLPDKVAGRTLQPVPAGEPGEDARANGE